MKTIYFAGGCFWGPQAAFDLIKGVKKTTVGYAQSIIQNPTYEQVCSGITNATETVEVQYDDRQIDLNDLLKDFFMMFDPTQLNRQGPDMGKQYRSGIYSTDSNVLKQVKEYIEKKVQPLYNKPVVVEVKKLENFYPAESYHQEFLKKNPDRHCNVNLSLFKSK